MRNVPSCPEGREAEEERTTTHNAMTTERDRIRGVTVVTFTPEEFHHFQSGTQPPGTACRKAMEKLWRYQAAQRRDGIGAPVEIRVREPEPPPADGEEKKNP